MTDTGRTATSPIFNYPSSMDDHFKLFSLEHGPCSLCALLLDSTTSRHSASSCVATPRACIATPRACIYPDLVCPR